MYLHLLSAYVLSIKEQEMGGGRVFLVKDLVVGSVRLQS